MKQSEFKKLVATYGEAKARKALAWFIANTTAAFKSCLKSEALYCEHNEYLWF